MATVTLSVKRVPSELARRLKLRARRNNRSLQGELLAILTDAGLPRPPLAPVSEAVMASLREVLVSFEEVALV